MKKPNENEDTIFKIRERRRLYLLDRQAVRSRRKEVGEHYQSSPLNMMAESAHVPRGRDGELILQMPQNSSLINNPENIIRIAKKLSAASKSKHLQTVTLDYSKVEKLDLGTECLLGIVAMEVMQEQARKRKKLRFRGVYPKNASYIRLTRGIGVIKSLDIKHERLTKEDEQKLKIFRYANRDRDYGISLDVVDTNARISAKFVDHINSCLVSNQRQLTAQAEMKLTEYTGEIIGNAEDHSGMLHWYIFGYLDNSTDEHICEVVILNFGKSIAQTFDELHPDHYAYRQVFPFVEMHSKKRLFNEKWTREDLFTLAALQGSVSSKNESDRTTRGQGTVELIEFFQHIHQECTQGDADAAKMSIVSGNTKIIFDGKYKMIDDEKMRKRISLNESGSLFDEPDINAISSMGNTYFPGTLISISFPLAISNTKSLE